MTDIPNFHNHEPGQINDDEDGVSELLGDIAHDLAHNEYQIELAQRKAAAILRQGEEFSSWLAKEFPDKFGGDNTLDPLMAYEFMQSTEQYGTETEA